MVQCPVYKDQGKAKFGKSIRRFIDNEEYWPSSLKRYFNALPSQQKRGGKLSYSALIHWMAEETGITMLADPVLHSKFEKTLFRYVQWGRTPEASAGDSFALLTAIALCGVARDKDGRPIKRPTDLLNLLFADESD